MRSTVRTYLPMKLIGLERKSTIAESPRQAKLILTKNHDIGGFYWLPESAERAIVKSRIPWRYACTLNPDCQVHTVDSATALKGQPNDATLWNDVVQPKQIAVIGDPKRSRQWINQICIGCGNIRC